MDFSELLILLHYEIQKSYDFVDAVSRVEGNKSASTLHIALEKVEIDLPVILEEKDKVFNPEKLKGLPNTVKILNLPYTSKSMAEEVHLPRKKFTGKSVSTKIIGPTEKIDENVAKENIGRIKVVLKPVIK